MQQNIRMWRKQASDVCDVIQDGGARVLDAQVQSRYQVTKRVFYIFKQFIQIAREDARVWFIYPQQLRSFFNDTFHTREVLHANLTSGASFSMCKLALNVMQFDSSVNIHTYNYFYFTFCNTMLIRKRI